MCKSFKQPLIFNGLRETWDYIRIKMFKSNIASITKNYFIAQFNKIFCILNGRAIGEITDFREML